MSAAARKGAAFERLIADYFRFAMNDKRIDRRVKKGVNDEGDIANVYAALGGEVVVEVKNHNRLDLAGWVDEAEAERGNADAAIGVVVHKRRGVGEAGGQYVTLSLASFVWLLKGGKKDEGIAA